MSKKESKKTKKNVIIAVLIPIIIMVFIACVFFSIVNGIIDIITGIVTTLSKLFNEIINDPLYIAKVYYNQALSINGWFTNIPSKLLDLGFNTNEYANAQEKPTIIISNDEFEKIVESLEKTINRDKAGLDDLMLKKMLLSYYKTAYPKEYTIKIELTALETIDVNRHAPFNVDIDYFTDGSILHSYLTTNGCISLYAIDNDGKEEKLVCYNSEGLKKIYNNEYVKNLNKDGTESKYSKSVREYLGQCYTIGDTKTIKMYNFYTEERNEEYLYNEKKISTKLSTNQGKEAKLITIDYTNLISEYGTPIEFLVSLTEISQSKEFVEEFIKLIDKTTDIKIGIYNVKTTKEKSIIEEATQNTIITGKTEYIVKDEKGNIIPHTEEQNENENKINIIVETTGRDCTVSLYKNDEIVQNMVYESGRYGKVYSTLSSILNKDNDWKVIWSNQPGGGNKTKEEQRQI